jgi:hypothetical protein
MRIIRRGGLAALALAAGTAFAGCGGDGGVASCTLTENVGTGTIKICEEISAANRQQLAQGCMSPGSVGGPDSGVTLNAQLAYAPCSHEGALGGCRITNNGVTVTEWWYVFGDAGTSGTSLDIQMLCASVPGGVYIAP